MRNVRNRCRAPGLDRSIGMLSSGDLPSGARRLKAIDTLIRTPHRPNADSAGSTYSNSRDWTLT